MEHMDTKWLEQQIREWESRGWVSREGAVQIRHILETKTAGIPLPLLIVVTALGLTIAGMALIWGLSGFWYQTSFAVRTGGRTAAFFTNRRWCRDAPQSAGNLGR